MKNKESIQNLTRLCLLLLMCFALAVSGCGCSDRKPEHPAAVNSPEIVDVDRVAENPEGFKRYFGITGTVIKADESKKMFILGCADACVKLPVKYRGQMPKTSTNITVFGEIRKEEGKYIFEAREVKER